MKKCEKCGNEIEKCTCEQFVPEICAGCAREKSDCICVPGPEVKVNLESVSQDINEIEAKIKKGKKKNPKKSKLENQQNELELDDLKNDLSEVKQKVESILSPAPEPEPEPEPDPKQKKGGFLHDLIKMDLEV